MVRQFLLAAFCFTGSLGLSQILEFGEVSRLPARINTRAEESMPLLSHDGKKLFFARALYDGNEGGEYAGQDVWVSEHTETGWKKASNSIASINNKNNNVLIGYSKDGKIIYFVNASPYHRMNGIYFSRQIGNTWSPPALIPIPGIENLDFIGFYVVPELDVIFLSMKAPDSRGSEDLYFTIKDKTGAWKTPQNLGATINTTGYEISPFLSSDRKRLYFASNGHKGEGDADIFYSERLYESWQTWSVPINLGPIVNSKKFDAYFSIYGDSVAYFSSNREGQYADIFKVKVRQGKTILQAGQDYLTDEEWNAFVGKNVSTGFTFPNKSSILSAAQKELIFYIVNKLMLRKDIHFHLVVREEEDPGISSERLNIIRRQLEQSGIDAGRINDTQVASPEISQRGVIEVRLFK